MAKIYQIEIEETLQKVVKIKADSLDEAIDIAQNRYSNQEYILDYEDYKGVEFRQYKDEIIKQKNKKERER
ncbi:MAG: DpnD/PcfM family protein [Clostridium sp.]|nr:DpnD/PcfM family protein [Clostridium sp.]MEE0768420.1 DpnD/PcfM family protein [Clostridia bacterium]